jgi:transcriptional regulator GlxA family with amidase domain
MRKILENEPNYPLSLEELSRSAHVSDKHLCRLFQQHIGQPPLKTFRLMKLQKAMAILGRSSLSIQEVANRCGFDNPLYFSRCFRQTYTLPPREARALFLKKCPLPANPLPPDIFPRIHW